MAAIVVASIAGVVSFVAGKSAIIDITAVAATGLVVAVMGGFIATMGLAISSGAGVAI